MAHMMFMAHVMSMALLLFSISSSFLPLFSNSASFSSSISLSFLILSSSIPLSFFSSRSLFLSLCFPVCPSLLSPIRWSHSRHRHRCPGSGGYRRWLLHAPEEQEEGQGVLAGEPVRPRIRRGIVAVTTKRPLKTTNISRFSS